MTVCVSKLTRFALACSLMLACTLHSSVSARSSSTRATHIGRFGGKRDLSTVIKTKKNDENKEIRISMPATIASGVLLAFNSGYINGCCLSGGIIPIKQAVAAVTGAYTVSAVGFSSGNYKAVKTQLSIIASYMGGSCIAGALNPHPVAFHLKKSLGPTFLIGSTLLYISSTMAGKSSDCMTIFYLAAIANGIQNSITSVHTGNLIRSAHYSGMTSDMGTFLGQILRGNMTNVFRLKVCAYLAAAFWSGGAVSFFATQRFTSASLLFSAVLYAIIGIGLVTMHA